MTRIGHQQLTQANRTGTITYDRTIEYLVMYNNNPVPLYVRLGSPELPTQRNYDIAVPPNYIMGISVDSNQFGFRLGDDTVALALISGVTVIEGLIDEPPPALGGVPIQGASLATADLNNGFQTFTGATVIGTFNLTLWGGVLLTLIPNSGSGQGVIQVDVSSDNITFQSYATYAFWPAIPVSLLLPRIGVFVRFTVNATAIVGEPTIGGKTSIRATLTELTQSSYNPQSNSIVKTWAIAALGSQQFTFVTVGLPSVSIAAIATTGSGAGAIVQLLVETSSDNVNWRTVTSRKQFMFTGQNLYRSFGNLGIFIRVTVSELSGTNASNGSLYMSIPPAPDNAGILNTIYQTLGDQGNPNPIGAFNDIYHELDQIRINDTSIDTKLTTTNTSLGTIVTNTASINTNVNATNVALGVINASLSSINTSIGATNTSLGVVNTSINTQINATNTALGTINGSLSTVNTSIGATNTALGTVNTALTTVNSHLTTIESYESAINTRAGTQSRPTTALIGVGAAGTWTRAATPNLNNGEYIISVHFAAQINHMLVAFTDVRIGIGTATSIGIELCGTLIYNNDLTGGANFSNGFVGPVIRFDGLRVGGYIVPATFNYFWVYIGTIAGNVFVSAIMA